MKAKLLEIFQSIQGEGKYAGVSQVFVRFFECNMHCHWCDTPHSIGDTTRNYQETDLNSTFEKIMSLNNGCHSVSLTGGEPLLQADFIKELLKLTKRERIVSYLETNGVLPDELNKVIDDIDIIAMDVKLPSSTKCQPFWSEHEKFLSVALKKEVFIKTVVTSDTNTEDMLHSIDLVRNADPNLLFIIQPNYFEMKNGVLKRCLEFQEKCQKKINNVRILPQIHKLLKVK